MTISMLLKAKDSETVVNKPFAHGLYLLEQRPAVIFAG